MTKKYLKKQDLRDFLRVIADSKHGYIIKFVNINDGEKEEGEGDAQ